MFPGMDPTTLMSMFSMLFGQGGQGGGGAQGGAMPPLAPQPPIPNIAEAGALPQSVQPGIQDQGPTVGSGGPAQRYSGPVDPTQSPMNMIRQLFNSQPTGPSSMSPTGGVPFPNGPNGPQPSNIGEALEPSPGTPAPGIPMPMARPPGLGAPMPGNYGGSPETNPNLRPIGGPAGAQPGKGPMDIAKLLGGISKPSGPDVVKPSTPAQPQRGQMGASQLMAILQSLMPGMGRGMRMPTTLGQAMDLKPSAWGGMYG